MHQPNFIIISCVGETCVEVLIVDKAFLGYLCLGLCSRENNITRLKDAEHEPVAAIREVSPALRERILQSEEVLVVVILINLRSLLVILWHSEFPQVILGETDLTQKIPFLSDDRKIESDGTAVVS